MPTPSKLVDLRQMLAERFPTAHGGRTARPTEGFPTGIASLDSLLGGGLARGELTEIVAEGPGSGSAQIIHAILARTRDDGRFFALVDGSDSFDVDAPTPEALARLLWVRCHNVEEALKATDLLLRDRNVPLVVLDLKLNPVQQLRKISSSAWHRFGRIVEHNTTTLLVITPFPLVGAVSTRVVARAPLDIPDLSSLPCDIIRKLRFERPEARESTPVVDDLKSGAA